MSTDIDITESPETANGTLSKVAAPDMKVELLGASRRPRIWQRRGVRLAVVAIALAVIVAAVGDNVLARQYTPEAAVRSYLGALQSGDASTAWNDLDVTSASQTVSASLTDQAAFRAAFASARPDINGFQITRISNSDSSHASVAATVSTSKGTKQLQILVARSGSPRLLLFPDWRVVMTPVVLTFTLPKASGAVSVDGKSVALSAGKSQVAVLPLSHRVVFGSTAFLAQQTVTIDGFSSGDQAVPYQPQLTPSGLQAAQASVKNFFNTVCAKQTGSNPDHAICPQTTRTYLPYTGSWQVIGDPTQGMTVGTDQSGNLLLLGRFQMAFAYTENGVTGTAHVPDGGGFSATTSLTDSQIEVKGITRATPGVGLDRPAGATDQAAKDLVAKAMASCAAVSAETVADCPQAAPDVILANVRWTLSGDPTSGATVVFDGKSGLLTVHGNFSMGVSYTWFGQARNRTSYVTAYNAYLFWDGQALQLVTISGSPS
jgi:hypothetical protein